jgi:hypothetical protein
VECNWSHAIGGMRSVTCNWRHEIGGMRLVYSYLMRMWIEREQPCIAFKTSLDMKETLIVLVN